MRCTFKYALLLTLSIFTFTPVWAETDLLHTLRAEHPRVLATAENFEELRKRRNSDEKLDAAISTVEESARKYLRTAPLEHKKIGKRMLAVSREAVKRISTLAMAYRMTTDGRFAERAEAELVNVCEFPDWNPSHFLDTAEMAAAVGIGYDWLFEELSEATKEKLQAALLEKALVLVENKYWWKTSDSNWNSVCYGGLTIGAMAIADREPEVARQVLRAVQANNPRTLAVYAPDGVYPEGPNYWNYGSTYQTLLISTLRTSLGTDLGLATPSFLGSGNFMTHAFGPTGQTFNFSDGSERNRMPIVMRWFAHQSNRPVWVRLNEQLTTPYRGGRLLAIQPLWMYATESGNDELPISWHGDGVQPVAMFRTSWSDSSAMYLALKGGSARLNHAHMDAGSFVMESDGVRWAIDMGGVNYNKYEQQGLRLFDRGEGGDRWKVFRHVNMAHNTLTVNGKRFKVDGHADITKYQALDEGVGFARVDMSAVISDADLASREFTFEVDARRVTIADRLEGLEPDTSVRWTMITRATPEIDGSRLLLSQEGETLHLNATSEPKGKWTAVPYTPPEGFNGESPNGVRIVRWESRANERGRYELAVVLQPSRSE